VSSFHVQTFGCRASQADGAAIAEALIGEGLHPAANSAEAQLVVLNSCTVTSLADEDVRNTIHRVHRENSTARILVTGCYAQRAPEEISV
jgi:threonylcarbamoyladenosine tRNA methylthiotransferase MtaB